MNGNVANATEMAAGNRMVPSAALLTGAGTTRLWAFLHIRMSEWEMCSVHAEHQGSHSLAAKTTQGDSELLQKVASAMAQLCGQKQGIT